MERTYYEILRSYILYVQEQVEQLSLIILIIGISLLLLLVFILITYIIKTNRLNQQITELKRLITSDDITLFKTPAEPSSETPTSFQLIKKHPKFQNKRNAIKKKNYYYTDKSQTPLAWHNWFLFTLVVGALTSLGTIFTPFSNYNYLCEIINDGELISTLELITGFECICNIAWAILCIFTAIGLSKFKTSGWICLIATFITRPVLNLVIGCMWMSFDLSLGIVPLISAFIIALSDIPIYIYYNKRKPLFFPEMINNIADEQKVKYLEMTHKDSEQLYKSDNLNKTIPLSDDE